MSIWVNSAGKPIIGYRGGDPDAIFDGDLHPCCACGVSATYTVEDFLFTAAIGAGYRARPASNADVTITQADGDCQWTGSVAFEESFDDGATWAAYDGGTAQTIVLDYSPCGWTLAWGGTVAIASKAASESPVGSYSGAGESIATSGTVS